MLVGPGVGLLVGPGVGLLVGAGVGLLVGPGVGLLVGRRVGLLVGGAVFTLVGAGVTVLTMGSSLHVHIPSIDESSTSPMRTWFVMVVPLSAMNKSGTSALGFIQSGVHPLP